MERGVALLALNHPVKRADVAGSVDLRHGIDQKPMIDENCRRGRDSLEVDPGADRHIEQRMVAVA